MSKPRYTEYLGVKVTEEQKDYIMKKDYPSEWVRKCISQQMKQEKHVISKRVTDKLNPPKNEWEDDLPF